MQFEFRDNVTGHYFKLNTIEKPMKHHILGLSYTSSGYGSKIPTRYKVQYRKKWYRVYCSIYSNIGTCYIFTGDSLLTVSECNE